MPADVKEDVPWPIFGWWAEKVLERIESKAYGSQRDIAKAVGIHEASLNEIKNGTRRSSSAVPALSELLEIPLPFVLIEDPADFEIIRMMSRMSTRRKNALIAYLEAETGD